MPKDVLRDEPSAKQRVLEVHPMAEAFLFHGHWVTMKRPIDARHFTFGAATEELAWENHAAKLLPELSPVPPPTEPKDYCWQVRRIERDGQLTQTIVMSEEVKARELYSNWCQNRERFGDKLISLVRFEGVTIESSREVNREQG